MPLIHRKGKVQWIPKKKKIIPKTFFKGPESIEKAYGTFTKVKLAERGVLKRPRKIDDVHIIQSTLENYKKLKKLGFPVARYQGMLRHLSKTEIHKQQYMMFERLKSLTYEDILAHSEEIYDILEKAYKNKISPDLTPDNFGIDKNGKVKILDTHCVNYIEEPKNILKSHNFNNFLGIIYYKIGLNEYESAERRRDRVKKLFEKIHEQRAKKR